MLTVTNLLLTILIKGAFSCNPSCKPINCILSSWSSWTPCSATCGPSGAREKVRAILNNPQCNGRCDEQLKVTENCNTEKCCPLNCIYKYDDWSACTGCGSQATRLRNKIIERPASCGGSCPGLDVEKENCVAQRLVIKVLIK